MERKRRHINQPRFGTSKQLGEFGVTFAVNRAVTGNGLDQQQPIFRHEVQDHIGHLAV